MDPKELSPSNVKSLKQEIEYINSIVKDYEKA
jgi:hypothetical protein